MHIQMREGGGILFSFRIYRRIVYDERCVHIFCDFLFLVLSYIFAKDIIAFYIPI